MDDLASSTTAVHEAMPVGDGDEHLKDEMKVEGAAATTNQPQNELSTLEIGSMINIAEVVYLLNLSKV